MRGLRVFCQLFTMFLCIAITNAQTYQPPVDGPMLLSGTFCELRTDHFHTGIDIKSSNGLEGDPIYAVTDGYISKIRIQSCGYGKALYLKHHDGLTSLYGHLHQFTDELQDYVDDYARTNELYEYTIELDSTIFPVNKGQLIAYMGNTGYSFGPHLHFEIRNHDYSIGYNALGFFDNIEDNSCPKIKSVALSSITHSGERILHEQIETSQRSNCEYHLKSENPLLINSHLLGVSLLVHDQQEGTNNQNGIYHLKLWVDDSLQHEVVLDSTSFDKARQINSHLDYRLWRDSKKRFHKCFKDEWNNLGIYREISLGIPLMEHKTSLVTIECSDYFDNSSTISFRVQATEDLSIPPSVYNYKINRHNSYHLQLYPFECSIPEAAVSKEIKMYATTSFDSSASAELGDKLYLHNCYDFLYKPISLSYHMNSNQLPMAHKLCFVQRCSNGKPSALITTYDNSSQSLKTNSWSFGDFEIIVDTTGPEIEQLTLGKIPAFKLSDEVWSISQLEYQVRSESEYVAAYLDAKTKTLSIFPTADQRKKAITIMVTDPLENESTHHLQLKE